MIDLLLLHLVLGFTVGGTLVSSATLIAERYGSALGGLVGGLLAISIVSFPFIGLDQGPETASKATAVFQVAFFRLAGFGEARGRLEVRSVRMQ